ncbi:U3 small nucleolar RNA-associated protein 4 homolog [Battus philenor]|uniref:U3 small nucleolar RNA-associated protein 4 homolog n=1 Tax=Battus philenor TaxID=42288 RepID=UPI0035CEC61C
MACKLHRVRYYNPKPEPINSVSFNKIGKLLAVARADASIEIWDLNYAPFLIKFIPGAENTSVEALGWVDNRLLSTGLGGALLEWDLNTLSIKNTVVLTGYAAWCLDVNPSNTLVAVGTEQGHINLYSVENDEILYKKLFDKQEGRIMCCKFNKIGNILVTGSTDTIRVWNVETGHATCRISVSRRGKETIVWCLAVLSDNIVVSGDSHGRLTFWDGTIGDQIESYTTHKSDILSIVVSDDEKSLYCSGVDPAIMNFIKVSKGSGKISGAQWVKNVQRNIHEHDVRALILNGDKLVSVGADGYLTLSSYPPKWVMRIPPMIPAIRSSVCAQKKLLLLRYSNHLEVWKLGTYGTDERGDVMIMNVNIQQNLEEGNDNTMLEQDTAIADYKKDNKNTSDPQKLTLTEKPVQLVSVKTKKNKQILSCQLSPNGQFIVYSTDSNIRMLKLDTEDESNISLTKVSISGLSSMCNHVTFTEDSQTMLVHSCGEIKVLHVDPEAGATVVQTISTDKHLHSKTALHFHVSSKTPSNLVYLIIADTEGTIVVWVQSNKKFEHYVTLPKYRCLPAAMTINSEKERIIIAYVDQKLIEYDLPNKKFTEWPGDALPVQWRSRQNSVASITTHTKRDALVFQDDTSLWIMDKNTQNTSHEPKPKKKFNKNNDGMNLKIIPIKYLAGFHWIGDDEAVTLEILPENIVSQLPPILATKRHNMG